MEYTGMEPVVKKKNDTNDKMTEMSQIIGNSAMLRQYAPQPVIQRIQFEDVEAFLTAEKEKLKKTISAKGEAKASESEEDDDDSWGFDDDKEDEEQKLKEDIYRELGEITYTLEPMNYGIIPNKMVIWQILDGRKNVEDYCIYLSRIFEYANDVYQKIRKESMLPGAFEALAKAENAKQKITITVLNADEHGFNPPIKLETGGKAFVYKDRPGFADKLVTDLFMTINRIMAGEKTRMPAYEQHAFGDTGLLSEFIAGEERYGSPYPSENFRGQAEDFQALQWVAKQIGLTDLHVQNVLFTEDQRIFPIDLEAFDTDKETGLYPPPKKALEETDSDDDFFSDPEEPKQDFPQSIKLLLGQSSKRTSVGTPSDIDPEKVFGGPERFELVSRAIEDTKHRLFEVPKRFVPVLTSVYMDSWAHNKGDLKKVSEDMTQKTVEAFKKRSLVILEAQLTDTMSKLTQVEDSIPIFYRLKNEVQQLDVTTGKWVTVALDQ